MKKAKFMLSVMALCCVMATAFAFKTQKITFKKVYTGAINQGGGSACQNPVLAAIISTTGKEEIRASTLPRAEGCPVTFTTETID